MKQRKAVHANTVPTSGRLYAAWRAAEQDVELLRNVDLDEAETRASLARRAYFRAVGPDALGRNPVHRGSKPSDTDGSDAGEDLDWMHYPD